jgi:SWI/SNF-related matrix-associated actin-dependent regulator 1 of chromatin subfamily A
MVKAHKRVILLSEMSYRSLPLELFVQINTLQPNLFPNFDVFSKRYCDAKQEIFGWKFDGKK